MLVFPPEHVIYGDYAYEVWDAEMIKYILEFFNPGNMRADILTKSLKKPHGSNLVLIIVAVLVLIFDYVICVSPNSCVYKHTHIVGKKNHGDL